MFWVTGRRMVIEGLGAERPQIPEPHAEDRESGSAVAGEENKVMEERSKEWAMPRTGMKLPVLPTQGGESITEFLSKRVISADDIRVASRLIRKMGSYQGQVAEVLWIARPVVYALAMQRLQGAKSRYDWRPWVLGFGMELAARELGKKEVRERTVGGLRGMTGLEKEELRRRAWGVAWWGMRGAFYENFTK